MSIGLASAVSRVSKPVIVASTLELDPKDVDALDHVALVGDEDDFDDEEDLDEEDFDEEDWDDEDEEFEPDDDDPDPEDDEDWEDEDEDLDS